MNAVKQIIITYDKKGVIINLPLHDAPRVHIDETNYKISMKPHHVTALVYDPEHIQECLTRIFTIYEDEL